ncbi:hypothetical protein [Croceicoccus marinus]|uniref:ATPase n=1 Tax=Croceicoccus marinus TaxID=450378 RepID=A0A7G6VRK5_9SPHN|nr:hypothetical protein [Croceicoccus marinus]QNE04370.1 hypothetical protein H4O24_10290 [Croceicoccus marinus]
MNRRRNIIRFGQEDQEDTAEATESAGFERDDVRAHAEPHQYDGHYELTDDMAHADPAFEADAPRRADWIVPALAVLALVLWTGFFAFAQLSDGAVPADFAGWAALIAQWSMPAALIVALWMLALRHSRAEAGRFADAAATLRHESIALEERLGKVNAELSIAREFLTAQGRDLESLGRIASERLSENAGRLQDLITDNGEQVDRLHGVSGKALDNMEKLRGQLPVLTNAARDLVNSIGQAGEGAHGQLNRLTEGFGRLGQAGEASTLKVDEMRARVNEALTEFERCADQLGSIASDRFAALDAEGSALRERLDQQEIDALAAVRERAEAMERILDQARNRLAEAEIDAVDALQERLAKLESESGDIAGRIARGETEALDRLRKQLGDLGREAETLFAGFDHSGEGAITGWRNRLTAVNDEADALMERFAEVGGEAIAAWRDRMAEGGREAATMFSGLDRKSEETLETVGSRVSMLSLEIGRLHGELLQHGETLEAEIAGRIERSEAATRTLSDRLRAGLEALDGEIEQRRQKGEAAGRYLTEALATQLDDVDGRIEERRLSYITAQREFGDAVTGQLDEFDARIEQRRQAYHDVQREFGEAIAQQFVAIEQGFEERRLRQLAAGREMTEAAADHLDTIDRSFEERREARIAAGRESLATLDAQLAEIDGELDERRRRQQVTSESLARHAEIISGRIADFGKRMEQVAESGREAESLVGASLAALAAKLTESREALSGTDKAVLALTDNSVRLLELIEASSRHTREALPASLGEAETRVTSVADRMEGLRAALGEAGENSKSLDNAVEAARNSTRSAIAELEQLHDRLQERGGEHAAQIADLRDTLALARSDSEAMAEAAEATLGGAISRLAEASREAVANIEGTSSDAVRAIAEKLAHESGIVVREAVEASTRDTLETLDAAVSRATSAARDAAGELEEHLNRVNEITGHLEYRVAEARRRAEEDIDDHFARRVTQITESLNSTAIDIDKVLSTDVSDSAWQAYLKGERGIFTRRAVRLIDNADARLIVEHFEADSEFREHVNRYIHDFEAMLRNLLSTREGNSLAVTVLSSDMGKLYVALAQSIERLRR